MLLGSLDPVQSQPRGSEPFQRPEDVSAPSGVRTSRGADRSELPAQAACLVSQKISAISSIFASSWSATATSVEPLVPDAPASFVASLNSVLSCGYFSKCG